MKFPNKQSGSLLILMLLAALPTRASDKVPQTDPFQPYLTGKAPTIVTDLGEEIMDSIRLRKVIFHSRDVQTPEGIIPTNIFAAIVRPAKPGTYPGLLVLHGGGGNAEIERAKNWAAQGYVVLTLDIPGVANPEKVPQSSGTWKAVPYGKSRFTATPDLTHSTIFEGVLAAVQGLYLLHAQPDVIQNRIGIVGISWGGYTSTIVSGLASNMVKATFSLYGSGFYDEGSVFMKELDKMSDNDRATWLRYLDAGRRIQSLKTPFFIAAGTNDNWFYPPAVTATLTAMKGPVNHLFAANANHKIPVPGGTTDPRTNQVGWTNMELPYFDYYLKNKGYPFPLITTISAAAPKKGNAGITVKFRVKSKTPIQQANVFYSRADSSWTKRVWESVPAQASRGGWYYAELTADMIGKALDCYGSVSDDRPVTVSSFLVRCN